MEVHAHAHTPRKKWTHYLWEFVMLFLAVFCGFLAEYRLEHKIENDNEKKFIESMVEDLKRDTANFRFFDFKAKETMSLIDSMFIIIESDKRDSLTSVLYPLARKITMSSYPFEIFDRTYSQMKSSGNLRLLHSRMITDSITAYYYNVSLVKSQQDFINNLLQDYVEAASTVFDIHVFHKMYQESGIAAMKNKEARVLLNLVPPTGNPPLANGSSAAINHLLGSIHYLYARISSVSGTIDQENEKAASLIRLLKEQYNIE